MPKRKTQTLSLEHLCLRRIAKDMETYWYPMYGKSFENTPRILHIIGPFDDLTSIVLESILKTLKDMKIFKMKYLNMLLGNRLKVLDLRGVGPASTSQSTIGSLIGCRCQKMVHLNLSMCSFVSNKVLSSMIPMLPNLQTLDLSHTKCSYAALKVIAAACQELVTLNIYNTDVTEDCLSALNREEADGKIKLYCPKLKKLNVSHIGFGIPAEASALFLKQRPNLLEFCTESLVTVLYLLHTQGTSQSILTQGAASGNTKGNDVKAHSQIDAQYQKFPLQSVECELPDINEDIDYLPSNKSDIISVVSMMCPNLSSVHFININSRWIDQIAYLSEVTHLSSVQLSADRLTFEESHRLYLKGIKPLLQDKGRQLKKVTIENEYLCTGEIGLFCPNVVELFLYFEDDVHHTAPLDLTFKDCFKHLAKLKVVMSIYKDNANHLCASFRDILSQAQNLQTLRIQDCSIDDATFSDGIKNHKFPFLRSISMYDCNSLTGNVILELLQLDNDLCEVNLGRCRAVTRADEQRMKKFVNENKYDVKIDWS